MPLPRLLAAAVLLAAPFSLSAQTAAPAPALDPAKAEALHQRYDQGCQLAKQGKLDEALAVFDGIVKEAPQAKGSLAYAGIVELQLGKPEKALDYLNALYAAAPDDFRSLLLLVQANQALRRDIRVEEFRKKLIALRAAGTPIHGLTDTVAYPREKLFRKDGRIEFNEFFDWKQEPHIVWEGVQYDPATDQAARHIILAYNADQSAALAKQDPKMAGVQVFLFGEFVIKDGKVVDFAPYKQLVEMPSYNDFHDWVLAALKAPPKRLDATP